MEGGPIYEYPSRSRRLSRENKKNNKILITGAGGFIGGALCRYFKDKGFTNIRGIDKKPVPNWYQRVPEVECLSLDLSHEQNCRRAVEGMEEVYQLAADMGGMGFIERFRVECLRSILINTHMIESAYRAGVSRYFFSSSACVYNTELQKNPEITALKNRMPIRQWLNAVTAGKSSFRRCSARNIGQNGG